MLTECIPDLFGFEPVAGRRVEAAFDGGVLTSDAGALLLGRADRAIRLLDRLAACFGDRRSPGAIEHAVRTLVSQRVIGIALGYEDLLDHDQLRHDPVLAAIAGKLTPRRKRCAPLAGKSTLNRMEHAPAGEDRYHKITHDAGAIEALFVDIFLEAHAAAPAEIVLDLDATDDPIHGDQEGRFFHGYYGATAICRSTSSAASICWRRSCGAPTSTPRRARSRKSRGSSSRSGRAGRRCGSSCAPIRALRATR